LLAVPKTLPKFVLLMLDVGVTVYRGVERFNAKFQPGLLALERELPEYGQIDIPHPIGSRITPDVAECV